MTIRTSKTRRYFSRRAFLRGVGASACLLPMLEGERAFAAGTGPKRLITIAWANGVAQPLFYPAVDTDPTANTIMQPLAALKSKVTMVSGLDYKVMLDDKRTYDGHFTFPTMYTGTYKNVMGQNGAATGPSIDQAVSTAVAKTVNLPVPLLTIAAQGKSASFRMDGTINTAETKVDRLYKTLFSSVAQPMGQVNPLTARRKSVIDYLVPELTGFASRRGNRRQGQDRGAPRLDPPAREGPHGDDDGGRGLRARRPGRAHGLPGRRQGLLGSRGHGPALRHHAHRRHHLGGQRRQRAPSRCRS